MQTDTLALELGTRAYTWATWDEAETIADPDWARFDYAVELAGYAGDEDWQRL